jgi:hypothetical protein
VAVVPDVSGFGYWLVSSNGDVHAFGDAVNYGNATTFTPSGQIVVSAAAATPTGNGYWILTADGTIQTFGGAAYYGMPQGLDRSAQATALMVRSDGAGYWVAFSDGRVFASGDVSNLGDMSGSHLNAPIIAATGW